MQSQAKTKTLGHKLYQWCGVYAVSSVTFWSSKRHLAHQKMLMNC